MHLILLFASTWYLLIIGIICHNSEFCSTERNYVSCRTGEFDEAPENLWAPEASRKRFLLYNVNPSEGFNLRRDVYLRVSVLLKQLREHDRNHEWTLVLPPWGPLYHWKTKTETPQSLPWSAFFDLNCINKFIPVIEFSDFIAAHGPLIHTIYYLQQDDWDGGDWVDKAVIEDCKAALPYRKENNHYKGWFWGYDKVLVGNISCVTVLGQANLLLPLIIKTKGVVLIDRAEVMLHDNFGDSVYWQSRQSMRFAKHLTDVGDKFRRTVLNSTDASDKTLMSDCEGLRRTPGFALGGNYIAAHLRRRDFLQSRSTDIPSLESAADQLRKLQSLLKISTVFVASDAPANEVKYLKSLLPGIVQYLPSKQDLEKYKDGGIAIIDQWICIHARYFVGTHESTFSFRIQEEREILGFDPDTTFNRLCGDGQEKCEQPARWRIVFD